MLRLPHHQVLKSVASLKPQSSKGGRYTVTLPDGTKVEELNKATAAMMVPFDSIKFSGNYGNMTEVSYQVAKTCREERC
ncbi:protein YdgH [Escherichia coli]|uniref:Protein YdgH n=1 Tax=Escherichia coli TaxID=562 RepID=A0A377BBD2_ECOLX|nr:protein YdgH [Escherichia coli]